MKYYRIKDYKYMCTHKYIYILLILDQVQLGQKYYAPQAQPDWDSNSWPPDHDITFHVTETPALTTWPSVTSYCHLIYISLHCVLKIAVIFCPQKTSNFFLWYCYYAKWRILYVLKFTDLYYWYLLKVLCVSEQNHRCWWLDTLIITQAPASWQSKA